MNNASNILAGTFRRGILARAIDQIKTRKSQREAVQQLNAMSDRLLADIGINRNDISWVVAQRKKAAPLEIQPKSQPNTVSDIRRAA